MSKILKLFSDFGRYIFTLRAPAPPLEGRLRRIFSSIGIHLLSDMKHNIRSITIGRCNKSHLKLLITIRVICSAANDDDDDDDDIVALLLLHVAYDTLSFSYWSRRCQCLHSNTPPLNITDHQDWST